MPRLPVCGAPLPAEPLLYVADSKHVPYGSQPPEFIRGRAAAIARHLIEAEGARLLVVACNTATTHAVDALRARFPSVRPVIERLWGAPIGDLAVLDC